MDRTVVKVALLAVMVAAAGGGLFFYDATGAGRAASERAAAEDNRPLREAAGRLRPVARRADLIVTGQGEDVVPAAASGQPPTDPTEDETDANGAEQPKSNGDAGKAPPQPAPKVFRTALLMVEYDADGRPLPARRLTLDGRRAKLGALVVRLGDQFGGAAADRDLFDGAAVALLGRIRGENQPAEQAVPIDPPGQVPYAYRDPTLIVTDAEQTLWRDVWRVVEDETYRQQTASTLTPAGEAEETFEPGKLYTLTLAADGALTVESRPLRDEHRKAIEALGSQVP